MPWRYAATALIFGLIYTLLHWRHVDVMSAVPVLLLVIFALVLGTWRERRISRRRPLPPSQPHS